MAWSLQGQWLESCSCAEVCPCNLGPEGTPDEGWCSVAVGLNIQQGNSNGVDLSNLRAAFVGDFPGNFFLGDGAMRIYLDEAMNEDQRRELEGILTGKMGGQPGGLADAVSSMLPPKVAQISIATGDNPSFSIAGVGQAALNLVKDENAVRAQLVNAPAGMAFGMPTMDLAITAGQWSDPDMRSWQPGGAGGVANFTWGA